MGNTLRNGGLEPKHQVESGLELGKKMEKIPVEYGNNSEPMEV